MKKAHESRKGNSNKRAVSQVRSGKTQSVKPSQKIIALVLKFFRACDGLPIEAGVLKRAFLADRNFQESEYRAAIEVLESEGKIQRVAMGASFAWQFCGVAQRSERLITFAVKDDAMAPSIKPGDSLIVDTQAKAKPGDVVLVRVKRGGNWVRRFQRAQGKRPHFSADNPAYAMAYHADEVTFHPVIEMRRKLRED